MGRTPHLWAGSTPCAGLVRDTSIALGTSASPGRTWFLTAVKSPPLTSRLIRQILVGEEAMFHGK